MPAASAELRLTDATRPLHGLYAFAHIAPFRTRRACGRLPYRAARELLGIRRT